MTHRAKKHLGQHFLNSEKIISRIVDTAHITHTDVIVEIGPGKGILTKHLLAQAQQVIAIEKDTELIPPLKEIFCEEVKNKKLLILNQDVLDFSPHKLSSYKLVANIPYYITGSILRHFLSSERQPQSMTLLMQKEVAERIVAEKHKESVLSLSVKAYGIPIYVRTVSKRHFLPKPKIDSAILHIANISRTFFDTHHIDEKEFFAFIKKGFAHKRKLLIKNLELNQDILKENNILPTARAEDLSLIDWISIFNMIKTKFEKFR